MATIGQTGVVIDLEEFGRALEKAAAAGIAAGEQGTAVELTAKGIAGTVIMETLVQRSNPFNHPPGVRGAQER